MMDPQIRYITPLRYPGGKSKLLGFVAELLCANDLSGCEYVEPYAGGASVAFGLLVGNVVSRVHINDIDPAIHAFWYCVLNRCDELCKMIRDKRVTVAEWKRQRQLQRAAENHDQLELAFSTFFLNRTNRSGIICSGGVIGGIGQKGKWKINARYNKRELIARIERIAKLASKVSLYREDAAALLSRLLPTMQGRVFAYLDPPYYLKGSTRLYANFYTHEDHVKIHSVLRELSIPWLVSYDDQIEIRKIYAGHSTRRYSLTYTAHDRYNGKEALFWSSDLKVHGLRV